MASTVRSSAWLRLECFKELLCTTHYILVNSGAVLGLPSVRVDSASIRVATSAGRATASEGLNTVWTNWCSYIVPSAPPFPGFDHPSAGTTHSRIVHVTLPRRPGSLSGTFENSRQRRLCL